MNLMLNINRARRFHEIVGQFKTIINFDVKFEYRGTNCSLNKELKK